MESRKDIHDRYLSKLEKHVEFAKGSSKYSSDRFDILIISLATSLLILSIGFVKDVIPNFSNINTVILKISWLLFLIALVSNLISQVTGYYANKYDIKVTTNLIREERGKLMKGDQKILESACSCLNRTTLILNGLSLLCLISGIVTLVIFFSNNI